MIHPNTRIGKGVLIQEGVIICYKRLSWTGVIYRKPLQENEQRKVVRLGEERESDFYTGDNFLFPPLYNTALQYLEDVLPDETIVDLGCGCGYLAELLVGRAYLGIDFCEMALGKVRKRVKEAHLILLDLRNSKNFEVYRDFRVFVALEVLEHIIADREMIASIPFGSKVVFSVPNFDSKAHVRWFENPQVVIDRYDEWLNFEDVTTLSKTVDKLIFVFNARRKLGTP